MRFHARCLSAPVFVLWLSFPGMAQEVEAVAWKTNDAAAPSIRAEGVYIRRENPLLEVYLSNLGTKPVTWAGARLTRHQREAQSDGQAGVEVGFLTNGVIWHHFYPTSNSPAGSAVVFQMVLKEWPTTNLTVSLSTADGQTFPVSFTNFLPVSSRLRDVVFSRDYRRMFIAYEAKEPNRAKAVRINGKGLGKQVKSLETPKGKYPGWLKVELPEPFRQGDPVHIVLWLTDGSVAQGLVRAWSGIYLDTLGLPEEEEDWRTEYGFDGKSRVKLLAGDPVWEDMGHGNIKGYSAERLVKERTAGYEAGKRALAASHMSFVASANSYQLYSACGDMLELGPTQLGYSTLTNYLEGEERSADFAREAVLPRSLGWQVEAATIRDRLPEAGELRLEVYMALGRGARGLRYWTWSNTNEQLRCYSASPPLLNEIVRLNAEVRSLTPYLRLAAPVEWVEAEGGYRYSVLWSGDDGIMVIVRNTEYTSVRAVNALGMEPKFSYKPNEWVEVKVKKPKWLTPWRMDRGVVWEDLLTRQAVYGQFDETTQELKVEPPRLDLVTVLWLRNMKPARQ
ncbi:MAG: hypothetical protein HY343_06495 [Lentisphaerae bacterium]|nr:hypothetical protein [Lentisphaerota bacterium]